LTALFSLGLALVACKDDPDPQAGSGELVVATYNAGLALGFVPGTESRAPQVAEAVAGLEADVVCLQEIWQPEHAAAVEAAAGVAFPNRVVPEPQQSSDASCEDGELDDLLSCITDSCDFTCADGVPDCLFASCPFQFISLSKECMRCAMANVGEDPTTVAATCETSPGEFAYGGSFGTMLLSKYPLGAVDEHVFASTSNRRSVLHAEVIAPGGTVSVFCTHLTAVFDTIPYPRETGSWAEEQLVQINELNDFVEEVGGAHKVLLGDLNTGPALEGIQSEAPEGYAALIDAGWSSPYVEMDGRCTFCSDNPLIASADDDDNRLIDHVMTQGELQASEASRLLDQSVSADSCAVDLSTAALSDHYGVQVTLTW
jgi:endonuclease/exonuclease/phosphatase family metal-dependent hydrolase